MKYTVDYFINKFEAIHEDLWTTKSFARYFGENEVQHCALGHCGASYGSGLTEEAANLADLFFEAGFNIIDVNDDADGKFTKYGATPKQRVLQILYYLKKGVKFP